MRKQFYNIIMMMAAALMFAAAVPACDDSGNKNSDDSGDGTDGDGTGLISVSRPAFHFTSKATDTLIVAVGGTAAWEVLNAPAWVTAEKRSDNTLRVTVLPSRSPFDRAATLTVAATDPALGAASLVVTQGRGTPRFIARTLQSGIPARHCSENGLWAVGQSSSNSVIVDIQKLLKSESYIGDLKTMPLGVHGIDNNGKPYENGCSADGTIYTDYETIGAKEEGNVFYASRYVPYIMRNNRRINLSYPETYTTSNITAEGCPQCTPWHIYQGCIPDKMSADGKHIYGRLMNTQMLWLAAKWTRIGETNDYTFKVLGLESEGDLTQWETIVMDTVINGNTMYYMTVDPVSFLCAQNISGLSVYGKYACGHYGGSQNGGGELFRYDMEADKLELLSGSDGIAMHVTDDGTLFDSNNMAYLLNNPTPMPLRDWLTQTYGEDIVNDIDPGAVMGSVSADYSTAVLFVNGGSVSYIITVEP